MCKLCHCHVTGYLYSSWCQSMQGMRRDECSGYLKHLIDHYEDRCNASLQLLFLIGLISISFSWNAANFLMCQHCFGLNGGSGCTIWVEEPADYTFFFQSDAADHLHWGYLSLVPQLAACELQTLSNYTNLLHDETMAIGSLPMMTYNVNRSHTSGRNQSTFVIHHVSYIMYRQHVHACHVFVKEFWSTMICTWYAKNDTNIHLGKWRYFSSISGHKVDWAT